jgi:hypothetical protein
MTSAEEITHLLAERMHRLWISQISADFVATDGKQLTLPYKNASWDKIPQF